MGSRCILSVCIFCYKWNLFGVIVFHRSLSIEMQGRCIISICVFCYMWNLFGIMVFYRHIAKWSVGGRYILSICAFSDMWNLCGVMVFHPSIVNWSGGTDYPQYMCILVYVKLILCNSIPYINCQLEFGMGCILSVCAFCSMRDLLGVMVFHRSFVNWIVR